MENNFRKKIEILKKVIDFLEADNRIFQFSVNQVEGEIISNTLKEIKENHNLNNNKEALLFLVNLYRVK